MNKPYSDDDNAVADETKPDIASMEAASLNDLLMIHHGFTSATELLESRTLDAPLLPPLLEDKRPAPHGLKFSHTFFPVDHRFLKSITPGFRRYEYQHEKLVNLLDDEPPPPCSARRVGFLRNQIVLPLTAKPGQEKRALESYSAFFFRFEPFPADKAFGMATIRLGKNQTLSVEKSVYSFVPGQKSPQIKTDRSPVETAFYGDWSVSLYCRVFTVPPLASPPTAPDYLPPPQRLAVPNRPERIVEFARDRLDSYGKENPQQIYSLNDNQQLSKLSFLYEEGREYLIEVGLRMKATAEPTSNRVFEHGLMLNAFTVLDVVRIDTATAL